MSDQGTGSAGQLDAAAKAALLDILAAIEADAAAPGAVGPVGHGTIRLRGRPDGPAMVVAPVAVAAPVGHGPIRLRDRRAEPAPSVAEDAPAAALDPIADIVAALAADAG